MWVPSGFYPPTSFFLPYISDINNASSLIKFDVFVDDTNVFMSPNDPDFLSDMLNFEMGKLSI